MRSRRIRRQRATTRRRRCIALVTTIIALVSCVALVAAQETADTYVPPNDLADGWYARIETTAGRILVQLLPEQAPQAVAHFVGFAEGTLGWVDPVTGEGKKARYYDGIQVYAAVAGQFFEAGEPTGPGSAPRTYVPRETGPINFRRGGRLGTVNEAFDRQSATKFFVTAAPMPRLEGNHSCFGRVIEGLETVFDITSVKTQRNSVPVEPITIEEIRVFTIGEPPPLAEPTPYIPRLRHIQKKEWVPDDGG